LGDPSDVTVSLSQAQELEGAVVTVVEAVFMGLTAFSAGACVGALVMALVAAGSRHN
jgi:hypothetical protein